MRATKIRQKYTAVSTEMECFFSEIGNNLGLMRAGQKETYFVLEGLDLIRGLNNDHVNFKWKLIQSIFIIQLFHYSGPIFLCFCPQIKLEYSKV